MSNVVEKIQNMCVDRLNQLNVEESSVISACNLCKEYRYDLPDLDKWKSCRSECPMYHILGRIMTERSELSDVLHTIIGVDEEDY